MTTTRRRRKKAGISQADPAEQVATLAQRSFVRAAELGREHPVRMALPVGTLDDGSLALVDPAGMVQLDGRTWVLDWWVGAEDCWHFPSSDPTTTQTLPGFSPVLETIVHVPGGNIIQRCYAARGSLEEPGSLMATSGVVVEWENQSAVPVALAVVLRPLTLFGEGSLKGLRSEGQVIWVDEADAVVLSRPIAARVVGPPGTVAIRLDLEDDESPEGEWSVDGQLAEGAFVVPLPHTAVVRAFLPQPANGDARGRRRRGGARSERTAPSDWGAPSFDKVRAGWRSLGETSLRLSSPDSLLDGLVAASTSFMSIMDDPSLMDGVGGHPAALCNALVSEALVGAGVDGPLEHIARVLVAAESLRGGIRMADRSDSSVALIHCASRLLSGRRSAHWEELLLGPVAKAIHRLHSDRGLGRRDSGGAGDSELAASALRRSAALAAARVAPALVAIGQPDVAESAHALYHRLAATQEADGDDSRIDPTDTIAVGLGLRRSLRSTSPQIDSELREYLRRGHLGLLPARMDDDGVPAGERPFDVAAVAVRMLVLLDVIAADSLLSLEVLPGWGPEWFGKPIEAAGITTRLGKLSFALRWHGERPVLLWEVEPSRGVEVESIEPVLTAPTLDRSWHAHGWSGEELLAKVTISQNIKDEIEERDRPRMSVTLGSKKPDGQRS